MWSLWLHVLPDHTVLQSASDHVDRHSLRLIGERHWTDDLSTVNVTNQISVDRPQPQITSSTHCTHEENMKLLHLFYTNSCTTSPTLAAGLHCNWKLNDKTTIYSWKQPTRITHCGDISCRLTGWHCVHWTLMTCETLYVTQPNTQKTQSSFSHYCDTTKKTLLKWFTTTMM